MEELTERVSVLHRENELLESALQAARSRSEEVRYSQCDDRTLTQAISRCHIAVAP